MYIVLFATIPFPKNAASWISFLFTLVSFVLSLGVTLYVFSKEEELTSKFYGLPIFKIACIYPIAQLAIGVLICLIAAFVDVPYWIALVLSIIILAAAAIGVIATDNARDTVKEVETEGERVTRATKMFNLNISAVIDMCKDADVKKELARLESSFRFSDPVSNEDTEAIEAVIMEKLENMKLDITSASKEENIEKIEELKNLLNDRNRICKANKR